MWWASTHSGIFSIQLLIFFTMARIFTYDSYGMYAVSVCPAGDEEPSVELRV